MSAFEVLVLALVLPMGATVLAFASRSLRHEPYRRRFLAVGAALTLTAAAFAIADHPVAVAAAWIATSILTVALLRTGPAPTGTLAARSFAIGDLALVAALALLAWTDLPAAVAGVLLVVAAAARSAVGPFSPWLVQSLATPTPTSALLHAGVVNAGPLLLLKEAGATSATLAGASAAVALGTASCLRAVSAEQCRPDVKGRLVWSTVAQMSFTMVLCGLGLHLAAGLHLVAHGAYKGTRFLGSGGAVAGLVRRREAPRPVAPGATALVAAGLATAAAAAAVLGSAASAGASIGADAVVPTALGWVATTAAGAAWWRRASAAGERAVALASPALAVAAFVGIALVLKEAVGASLPAADPALSPWLIVPVLAALTLPGLPAVPATRWRPRPLFAPEPSLERS